jgi:hypothetical protein
MCASTNFFCSLLHTPSANSSKAAFCEQLLSNKTTAKIATIRLMALSLTMALLGCLGEITN